MSKKTSLWILVGFGMLAIAGCATGSNRNTDAEISSLNSRVASLQNQLSAKDQEIAKLQGNLADQRAELNEAEAQKLAMSDKLDAALSDLNAAKTPKKSSPQESDLK